MTTAIGPERGPVMLPKDVGIGRPFDDIRDTVIAADPRTGRIVL